MTRPGLATPSRRVGHAPDSDSCSKRFEFVIFNFNKSFLNASTLQPLCEAVDKHFNHLTSKIYCHFAVEDDEYFVRKIGRFYRGFQFPASSIGEVPEYTRTRYLVPGTAKYDHFIYLRHSTCLDPTACVVTYAHELQHIVQHDCFPKLAEVNWVLYSNLAIFEPGVTEIDIPAEVDANIASKRVAEKVCGVDCVRKFAEDQVRLMRTEGVASDAVAQQIRWEYFLNTPSSLNYDFIDETLRLVKKYERHMNFGMDVTAPEWWKGPLVQEPPVGLL
jgi:hypothetical protein